MVKIDTSIVVTAGVVGHSVGIGITKADAVAAAAAAGAVDHGVGIGIREVDAIAVAAAGIVGHCVGI